MNIKDIDICENKHQQNAESIEANPATEDKAKDQKKVYEIICNHKGITSKGIAERMDKPLNCISGRISELKRINVIEGIGRRDGCAILHPVNDPARFIELYFNNKEK